MGQKLFMLPSRYKMQNASEQEEASANVWRRRTWVCGRGEWRKGLQECGENIFELFSSLRLGIIFRLTGHRTEGIPRISSFICSNIQTKEEIVIWMGKGTADGQPVWPGHYSGATQNYQETGKGGQKVSIRVNKKALKGLKEQITSLYRDFKVIIKASKGLKVLYKVRQRQTFRWDHYHEPIPFALQVAN